MLSLVLEAILFNSHLREREVNQKVDSVNNVVKIIHLVIAVDMDPIRLKCAKENARVYGVEVYRGRLSLIITSIAGQNRFYSGRFLLNSLFMERWKCNTSKG